VGLLLPGSSSDPLVQPYLDVLRRGLRELGYVEGQSITIEYRWAEGKYERLPDLASELVRLKGGRDRCGGDCSGPGCQTNDQTIPIVMTNVDDPVATGLVASMARPGGNITGLSLMSHELVGKQLGLLREVVPKVSRVAVLWNRPIPLTHISYEKRRSRRRPWACGFNRLEAQRPSEIDRAFAAMTRERMGALLVLLDSMLLVQRERIADLAAKKPPADGLRASVARGGRRPYGLWRNLLDMVRRIAGFVDRISRARSLPISRGATHQVRAGHHLKTAKALGSHDSAGAARAGG